MQITRYLLDDDTKHYGLKQTGDGQFIADLAGKAFAHAGPDYGKIVSVFLASTNTSAFVAVNPIGEQIGFALTYLQEPVLDIPALAVDQRYRGFGVGWRLLRQCFDEARRVQAHAVTASVMAGHYAIEAALDAYGFQPVTAVAPVRYPNGLLGGTFARIAYD